MLEGYRVILASGSPRRKEILHTLGLHFEIEAATGEETSLINDPGGRVMDLAEKKGMEIALLHRGDREPVCVIGADTLVVLDEQFLGKPSDEQEALCQLRTLQGRFHQVYTGVCLVFLHPGEREKVYSFYNMTKVHFYVCSDEEIKAYIQTGEPMDKAGSYGIQGLGGKFISGIEGDYNNVVGFPAGAFYQFVKTLNFQKKG